LEIDLRRPEVQFAIDTVQFGSELARRVRAESSVKTIIKQDDSPVTLADMGIQAVAGALLEHYFPKSIMVAEESSTYLRSRKGEEDLDKIASYVHAFFPRANPSRVCEWIDRGQGPAGDSFWTLDPIDGTKGFLRGGQYAIALALIRDGKVELAALACPELETPKTLGGTTGLMVLAARGQGCWGASIDDERRWVPVRVSGCEDIARARILDSFELRHQNIEKSRKLREALGIVPEPVPLDSQAKHVVLASGGAEIFFRTLPQRNPEFREKIWDVAPGAFAIEEAGGRVTDLLGDPIDYGAGKILTRSPGFLATNGRFHDVVLGVLQKRVS